MVCKLGSPGPWGSKTGPHSQGLDLSLFCALTYCRKFCLGKRIPWLKRARREHHPLSPHSRIKFLGPKHFISFCGLAQGERKLTPVAGGAASQRRESATPRADSVPPCEAPAEPCRELGAWVWGRRGSRECQAPSTAGSGRTEVPAATHGPWSPTPGSPRAAEAHTCSHPPSQPGNVRRRAAR